MNWTPTPRNGIGRSGRRSEIVADTRIVGRTRVVVRVRVVVREEGMMRGPFGTRGSESEGGSVGSGPDPVAVGKTADVSETVPAFSPLELAPSNWNGSATGLLSLAAGPSGTNLLPSSRGCCPWVVGSPSATFSAEFVSSGSPLMRFIRMEKTSANRRAGNAWRRRGRGRDGRCLRSMFRRYEGVNPDLGRPDLSLKTMIQTIQ